MGHLITLRHTVPGALAVVMGGMLLTGCVASSSGEEEEDVAEVQEAFTETACGYDATHDASTSEALGCYNSISSTSANGDYNHTDCTHGYIVDFDNTFSSWSRARAEWADALPTTQLACIGSAVQIRVYDSAGNLNSTGTGVGVWNGSNCSIPYAYAATNGMPSYGRVVAQAYTWIFLGSTTYKKVTARVYPQCG